MLSVPIESIAEQVLGEPDRIAALGTLRRDQGGPERFCRSLAELYVRGGDAEWVELFDGTGARRIRLPTYAFQRARYWVDAVPRPTVDALPRAEDTAEDAPAIPPAPQAPLASRVVAMSERERLQAVLDAVLAQAAVVLGHASAADVDARLTFKELGFDSPATIELRNRVNRVTGLRLASTVLFDNPTPTSLAERVLAEITGVAGDVPASAASTADDEPVAIVGIACRYPGGVRSAEDLWDLVAGRGDAIGEFPSDRGWDVERLFDPEGDRAGTSYVRHGGFVYDAGDFDAEHFGISPREALAMDPQQRLLLECAWEALEDAGIDPLSLRGSDTGVFAGLMSQDYGPPLHEPDENSAGYALTGTETSVASGRVAYVLGLEGPAVSVDTACSSSLVSLHLACQALRAGECSMALSGGATVMASPGIFVEFSRQRGLSPDGRCRAFGAGANGTGWAEGAGVLVLERLSVARERGHRVLAVVRGSAINQDGASNGLTAPSGRSQERVIRAALTNAEVQAADVDAVEAHGTGTTLGDPIEAQALITAYGRAHAETPLRLGSLKSNIGHAQAAAGVGGVIKMVQALRHEVLAGDAVGAGAVAARRLGRQRGRAAGRAGGVARGRAGCGAPACRRSGSRARTRTWCWRKRRPHRRSRRTPCTRACCRSWFQVRAKGRWRRKRVGCGNSWRSDRSLTRWRSPVRWRSVERISRTARWRSSAGCASLAECLRGLERDEFVEGLVQGQARRDRRIGFVFPGQGGQWDGMALELWKASPVFAASMQECASALGRYVDWSLEDVLQGAPGAPTLERVDVVQPALFAVMVSLAALWRSFGVNPTAVVGHSQGEIAAAHVAGALSLDDAARVVAVRSHVLREMLSGLGGMVSVGASAERVDGYLDSFAGRALAAVNGPSAVVVSGEPAALDELIAVCEADGIRTKLLPVDYAAHSAQIEVLRDRLLAEFGPVSPRPGEVPLYSTVTGERVDTAGMDAEYWYRNLRQTVQFAPAVEAMVRDGVSTVIEVSPHPVLTAAALETIEAAGLDPDGVAVIGSLRRGEGGLERFMRSLAEAHVAGVTADWSALLGHENAARETLPTYAFQRRRYWQAPQGRAGDASALGLTGAEHPLLDTVVPLATGQGTVFTGRLSLDRHPWLADHVVVGNVLLPAAGFLELALHAATRTGSALIEELTISAPLRLEDDRPVAIQVTVSDRDENGRRRLGIYSCPDTPDEAAEWREHATASLGSEVDAAVDFNTPWPEDDGDALDVDLVYERLAAAGYEYGAAFQGLRRLVEDGDELFARLGLDDTQAGRAAGYHLHPALLDSALQVAMVARLNALKTGRPEVPFSFSGVRLLSGGASSARARVSADGNVLVLDEAGTPILSIESVRTRAIDPSKLEMAGHADRDALFEVRWDRLPDPSAGTAALRIAILGEGPVTEVLDADADRYPDLEALETAIAGGAPVPDCVVAGPITTAVDGPLAEVVHVVTERGLALLKAWLGSEHLADSKLVIVTRDAVAVDGSDVPDLAQAALPGLIRSARTEHPDRFALLDVDAGGISSAAIIAALRSEEPEVAIRQDVLLAPRLTRLGSSTAVVRGGAAEPWHVAIDSPGTLETLSITANPRAAAPLGAGQVRVAVHAAGLNFKDVVGALGLVDFGDGGPGLEGAGAVLEVASDVTSLAPGDRVMGLIPDAFGPVAVTDSRLLDTDPGELVLRRGCIGSGRVPDRLLRARRPGRPREGRGRSDPRRRGWGRHGGASDRRAHRCRCLRDRAPAEMADARCARCR